MASFSAGRSPPGAPKRAPDASKTRCNEHAQRLPPFTNSWGPRRAPGPARHARSRTRLRFACTGGETVTSGLFLGRRGRRRRPARTGRGGRAAVSAAAAAGAQQPASPTAACPPPPRTMAGSSSLEAVRRKIRSLQEQADAAEERAGSLQRELDYERKLRETVRDPPITHPPEGVSSPVGPTPCLRALGSPTSLPLSSCSEAHLAHLGGRRGALGRGSAGFFMRFSSPWLK